MKEKYIDVYNPILDKTEKVLVKDLVKSYLLENLFVKLNSNSKKND